MVQASGGYCIRGFCNAACQMRDHPRQGVETRQPGGIGLVAAQARRATLEMSDDMYCCRQGLMPI